MAVTISLSTATLYAGDRLQLSATCSLGGTISWTSSDPDNVAVGASTGLVNVLVGKGVGAATITATSTAGSEGANRTCVLTTYGISTGLVSSKLGLASGDVGTLCSSNRINPCSIYKPLPKNTNVGPVDIYSSAGDTFYKTDGGLQLTVWDDGDTLLTFLGEIAANTAPWPYVGPAGTSSQPYRLGDFRGYLHTAKNKSALNNLVAANPTTYSKSWLNGTETIVRGNWDKYTLENNVGTNLMKFSDIWVDMDANGTAVSTDALSTFYLTCVLYYPNLSKYYAKSFGLMSNLTVTNGINLNIPLEDLFQVIDTTVGRKLWSNKPSVKRYYFLTKSNVDNNGGWVDVTSMTTQNRATNVATWGSKVVLIPLMNPGTYNKFYIENDILMRTYVKTTVVNELPTAKPLTARLKKYIGASARNDVDSNYFTLPGSGNVVVGLNNIITGDSPSDAVAYLYDVDLDGINDTEHVTIHNAADLIVGTFSKSTSTTGTMTLMNIADYLGSSLHNWSTITWSWKVDLLSHGIDFKNGGSLNMYIEVHDSDSSNLTSATITPGSYLVSGDGVGEVHFHYDKEYTVYVDSNGGTGSQPIATDTNGYFLYITLMSNPSPSKAWYKFKFKEGLQPTAAHQEISFT